MEVANYAVIDQKQHMSQKGHMFVSGVYLHERGLRYNVFWTLESFPEVIIFPASRETGVERLGKFLDDTLPPSSVDN